MIQSIKCVPKANYRKHILINSSSVFAHVKKATSSPWTRSTNSRIKMDSVQVYCVSTNWSNILGTSHPRTHYGTQIAPVYPRLHMYSNRVYWLIFQLFLLRFLPLYAGTFRMSNGYNNGSNVVELDHKGAPHCAYMNAYHAVCHIAIGGAMHLHTIILHCNQYAAS